MKKIFLILFILIGLFSSAQYQPINRPLQYVNTFGYEYERFGARYLLGLPADTFAVPALLQNTPFLASKDNILYLWNITTHIWEAASGASGGGFFSPDQTATGPTTHIGGGFPFLLNMVESFMARAPDAIDAGGGIVYVDSITALMQAVRDVNHRAGFNTYKDENDKWNAIIDASDSIKLQYYYPNQVISIADSAQWYMMVQRKDVNGTLGKAFWPVGGGSGIDSGAYRSMAFIDDSTVVFQRLDGTEDTLVYSAGAGGSGVSNFIDLADGPGAFTGQSLKSIRVNAGETALEYFTLPAAGDVTKVGTPVDNQIGVWTGNGTIEGPSTLTWSGSQLSVTGASTSTAGIDVFNGAYGSILLGGDLNAATRTNSTVKHGGIAAPHYLTAEEPVSLIRVANQSATNDIVIGQGVNPGYNSATSVGIYSAATNATLVGTRRFYLTNTLLHVNDGAANYDFRVSGDNDANAFSIDADVDRVLVGTALGSGTDKFNVTGNIALLTAGSKLKIATGSNASIGVSGAMTAGTITISTTAVTASSIIMLTNAAPGGGTVGVLSVGTITAGTSFIINSSSGTDTSTVNWWIVN